MNVVAPSFPQETCTVFSKIIEYVCALQYFLICKLVKTGTILKLNYLLHQLESVNRIFWSAEPPLPPPSFSFDC